MTMVSIWIGLLEISPWHTIGPGIEFLLSFLFFLPMTVYQYSISSHIGEFTDVHVMESVSLKHESHHVKKRLTVDISDEAPIGEDRTKYRHVHHYMHEEEEI